MSKEQDILILEASPIELRLSRAVAARGEVRFLDARAFRAQAQKEDGSALSDQHAVDALAAYVSQHHWNGKDVLCLLNGSAVSCHYFDMPPLNGNSLKQAVHLKLGQQLHFSVDEALVHVSTLAPMKSVDGDQLRVAATAIRRSVIKAAVKTCHRLESPLMMLSAAPAALTALATSAKEDAREMQALLYVGGDISTLIILQDGRPCVTSEIEIGSRDFATALMRPIIDGDNVVQLDEAKATALRNEVGIPKADQQIESLGMVGGRLLPLLEPLLQKLSLQITQWMSFAATSADGRKVSHLKLVGPGAEIPGLASAMGKRVGVTASDADWLKGLACVDSPAEDIDLSSCAAAISAVLHQRDLPDLLPPDVRQRRRVLRVRRSAALVTPVVAAAILGVGFLFDAVATKVAPSLGAEQAKLAHLQRLANDHNQWSATQRLVAQLQQQLDGFSRVTPRWDGLFKELSRTLPPELQVTGLLARTEEGAMFLTLRTRIFTSGNGRSFDEVLEQTLMTLERSPFFRRVQPLGSNRLEQDKATGVAGTMDVELELAFPKPRMGA
jgi:Tfp pilus assembly PilM family ATPase/Tfp pilus assembly protein PilN